MCVHLHLSLDSVYAAVELQTATHQCNSLLGSDPALLNTVKEECVTQLSILTISLPTDNRFLQLLEHTRRCVFAMT